MKSLSFILGLMLLALTTGIQASEAQSSRPFKSGSYQELLARQAGQPYVLVIWSITCSSCIAEMDMLREVHAELPDLKIIMLATDDISEIEQVDSILSSKGIADLESWVFADVSSQRLRYEIDPSWYGEIPRLYFFDANRQRQGFSGKMTKQQFLGLL